MTELGTIARERAMACEAKKHAYRQTQDGVVISFVLHPQEVPDGLALAPLGARFQLAMVALSDDETPAEPLRKVAPDKRLAQQAGMCCADPVFWRFLEEQSLGAPTAPYTAAIVVRQYCGVTSRSEIIPGTPAAEKWDQLYSRFVAWREVA